MRGYVLIADGVEQRASARVEQLALDGWDARAALRPLEARQMLRGADVVVLGEFAGSAAPAQEIVRDIRAGKVADATPGVRVIATADSEAQIISALSAGADLTVARGASTSLVSASVAALDRRESAHAAEPVRVGALEIDAAGREVRYAGKPVRLSGREMDVLVLLAQKPGRVFSRDEISWEVWGGPELKSSRTMDSHVHRMAQKFRAAGGSEVVQNVWGRGYKLSESGGVEL
jgi:DNA-binding response OmpR family regulator